MNTSKTRTLNQHINEYITYMTLKYGSNWWNYVLKEEQLKSCSSHSELVDKVQEK